MTGASLDTMFRTVLEIERSDSLERLRNAVRSFATSFGYDRFVLFSASLKRDGLVDKIYWVEGDWFGSGEEVSAEVYVRRCPVTRHLIEARAPFFWTKIEAEEGERYRIVRRPAGPGLHGLQVPVFGPSGLEAAVSFGGERIDTTPGARLALTVVATAAASRARQLNETVTNRTALSVREREILAWTAAGRRQAEIAATLGLSDRTVENHLRRIRHKLGVVTTAQAVRLAIRNGEIDA